MTDATLHDALRTYQENLLPGDLQSFRIDPNDHLGIPVVDATFIPQQQPRVFYGVGYGADEVHAQVSAFGEMHEEMAIAQAFLATTSHEASYREMVQRQGSDQVIDPLTLVLPAGSPYTPDTPLRWIGNSTIVRRCPGLGTQ